MTIDRGFWLQHGAQNAEPLVALTEDLTQDGYRPGVIFTPSGAPATLSRLYERARGRGEAFLDPCGYLIDRDPSPRRAENFPWLDRSFGRPTDTTAWARWMQIAVDHSLSDEFLDAAERPSIVVTPSPQLTAAVGTDELYAIVDAATETRDAYHGDPECWLGIDIDRDYLRNEARLTELADTVVNASFPGLVLRCFQSELPPITDRRLLDGLRELVEGCAAADIEVALPGSGWIGWLASAWGATAYSGGISKSSWVNRMPSPMANVPRRDSIFEPQLLRHVRWDLHEELSEADGYEECTCRSCAAMGGVHDADDAKVHQIRVAHMWSNESRGLNAHAQRRAIRTRIDAAIDFRDSLSRTMQSRVEAGFLDNWRGLL